MSRETRQHRGRWPIGRLKFDEPLGDGYALVSLIPVGQAYHRPIVATEPETSAPSDPAPFDLLGTVLTAELASQGPDGPALYGLCLVHGSTKAKLVELVNYHAVGIQPVYTISGSPQDDGIYRIESIDEVRGVKVVVGDRARLCSGRIVGLVDFRLSHREFNRVIGNDVGSFRSLTTDASLLKKRLRSIIRPIIIPFLWVILGVLLDRVWAWIDAKSSGGWIIPWG